MNFKCWSMNTTCRIWKPNTFLLLLSLHFYILKPESLPGVSYKLDEKKDFVRNAQYQVQDARCFSAEWPITCKLLRRWGSSHIHSQSIVSSRLLLLPPPVGRWWWKMIRPLWKRGLRGSLLFNVVAATNIYRDLSPCSRDCSSKVVGLRVNVARCW